MRRPIVAGNWKMNLDLAAGRDLIASIRAEYATAEPVEVIVCPPAPYLFPAAKALDGCEIHLGAQDLYYTKNGAYTGEISAEMIAETGRGFCHRRTQRTGATRSAISRTIAWSI